MKYPQLLNETPQNSPLNTSQVKNNAGGFVFTLDKWKRLERFLVLGSDSPTYYQKAEVLTRENAQSVIECWTEDPYATGYTIAEISKLGRAPKNDPAIFALALGATHKDTLARQCALDSVMKVCRTSTHLFQFVAASRSLGRGWGRAFKRAIANWYNARDVDKLAYQAIKYRSREGYSHKRLLQTAHPKGSEDHTNLFRWICGKEIEAGGLPGIVNAHLRAMEPDLKRSELIELIKEHRLPWEALPTEVTKDPRIWGVMVPSMGLTALIRNLGAMTSYGTLKPLNKTTSEVIEKLSSGREIAKARLHPFSILQALTVYESGQGVRGALSWSPVRNVVSALDEAFYKSFKSIEPTGKSILLALDVSGSMDSALMGSPITARAGASAMAMATMRSEKNWHVVGFSGSGGWGGPASLMELPISDRDSLQDVMGKTDRIPFGRTDCALPMIYALENDLKVDAFVIYTDNETYSGAVHPVEALKKYRKSTGINAKLIVVGMTSSGFTIADPNDNGMLDVVGFDSNCPALIANFIRQ